MKRLSAIAAIAVGSLLLVGCESQLDRNKHACGLFAANEISFDELNEKLGVKYDGKGYCLAVLGIDI